jgi:methylenetetrahydrofolate--tRNA-(uracil-5-)-methyltransferase
MTDHKAIHIIGAGLAGSEAAWQIAKRHIPVVLHEMRPHKMTAAHHTGGCAELVCSNSFRSDDHEYNAVGLIHHEMRQMDSLIMRAADKAQVPAGSALAVDREVFSSIVTECLRSNPFISFAEGEVTSLADFNGERVIVATGPLTSDALSQSIIEFTGMDRLAFFDAIAPIVYKDSINFDIAWMQSRYDKEGPGGTGKDYINCPFHHKADYIAFVDAILTAEKTTFKEFEKDTPYFDACLPIEVMAERGLDTLRFGPMKPVGLADPRVERRPYAVVQLRQDNKLGSLYNIVGFQTKMKYAEQTRIFRMIPGLENAEFARLGGIHRNTFIKSPLLLDNTLRLKSHPHLRFAGQITGCEGYVESAAVGLMAGLFASADSAQQDIILPPATTAMGALLAHITRHADIETYQPMNVNFGLFETLENLPKGRDRKKAMTDRAKSEFQTWQQKLVA